MPSLIDIGDLTEHVEVRGKTIDVQGVSAKGLMYLFAEFPDIRRIVTGNSDDDTLARLIQDAPDMVAAIIASGTGSPGDERATAQALKLSVGEQLELLAVIWKLTFPRGVKSFIEALEALAAEVGGGLGKEVDTKSPEPSSSASTTDTLPT